MSETPSSEELARLRALVPLHTMPEEAFNELVEDATVDEVAKGKFLFRQGESDQQHVYLLDGVAALLSDESVVERVRAGSDTARFPLAHQMPRQYSARADSRLRVVRIDSRRLSDLLARIQTVDYQVSMLEEGSEDDWMTMLLQSPVLQQVPAANIQQVIMSVEQVEVAAGEDLVRQGDPGDYYYMITKGRAVVTTDPGEGQGPRELATLQAGDAFGEEALLSDSPRRATVTMLQDGEILRLSKEHFLKLIHNPLVNRLDRAQAQARVDAGGVWVDLRGSEEYDQDHLPGAINIPFENLRYQVGNLEADRHYVLYSNSGTRAMAGAFLMTERGLEVSVLEGGLQNAPAPSEPDATTGQAAVDPQMQERIHAAEARAKELEARLEAAQRDQESVEAERREHLEQVRQAVEQARERLAETESQKREALAAQEKAYEEMGRLTSSLEELQTERTSMLDRMSEIEGLDKQLQNRLGKAERELIGERDRAESATSSLEDLSQRLTEVLETREFEREQHARERGELKEELTALHVELEQAQLDLEELQERLTAQQADASAGQGDKAALEQRLAAAVAAAAEQQAARDQLQHRVDELAAQGEALTAARAECATLQTELQARDARQSSLDGERTQAQAEIARLQGELDERRAQTEAMQARLEEQQAAMAESAQAQGQLGEKQAELDAAVRQLRELEAVRDARDAALDAAHREQLTLQTALDEARRSGDALRAESQQLHDERDALQARVAGGDERERSRVEAAESRVAELEALLAEARQAAERQSASAQEELERLRSAQTTESAALDAARAQAQALQEQLAGAEADAAQLDAANARIAALEGQQGGEQQALAEARAKAVALEAQLAEAQRRSEEQAATDRRAVDELRASLAAADARVQTAEHALAERTAAEGRASEQQHDEVARLKQRVEERELALAAAREQQAELIDALNAANAERDELQLACNAQQDGQAHLDDVENQLIEAMRLHQTDLLTSEQEQQRLREQLGQEEGRRHALQDEVARLTELVSQFEVEQSVGGKAAPNTDLKALEVQLAQRDEEIRQLRSAVEASVEKGRDALEAGADDDELSALRAELKQVREQAVHDVAHMREQLAAAEVQKRRFQQVDGREAVSHEVMRQRIEALESALNERQRLISEADESRQMLEDSLEDRDRQLDELRRELDKAQVDSEEAAFARREAETARDQLQQALYRLQEDAEAAKAVDLRDERLKPPRRAIGIDSVAGISGWLAGLIGAAVAVGGLEVISFIQGKGELFSALFKLAGQ